MRAMFAAVLLGLSGCGATITVDFPDHTHWRFAEKHLWGLIGIIIIVPIRLAQAGIRCSVQHAHQIGANRLAVQPGRHQGHRILQPQTVNEAPCKNLVVACG